MTDPQQDKLYAWEDHYFSKTPPDVDSLHVAASYAAPVIAAWGCRVPRLVEVPRRRKSNYFDWTTNTIELSRLPIKSFIVIHEAVHAAQFTKYGFKSVEAHGKEFLGMYLVALHLILGNDLDTMRAYCWEAGLQFTFTQPHRLTWDASRTNRVYRMMCDQIEWDEGLTMKNTSGIIKP